MAINITRYDPFKELSRLDPFGDLGWPRVRRLFDVEPVEPTIRLDVTESDKAFTVKAEIPGVAKEDIDVQVSGNQVSLSAEVKREKEEKKDETVVHSERYYGKQYRSFTLSQDIDRDKAEAKFDNGVLTLTLPKLEATRNGKIAVQ